MNIYNTNLLLDIVFNVLFLFTAVLAGNQFGKFRNSATHYGNLEYLWNSAANLFGNSVISQQILQSGPLFKEWGLIKVVP